MRIREAAQEAFPALPIIVSMSPPGYPSAWLRPRRARFRFARQDHCSSTTSIRLNFRFARHPPGIGLCHLANGKTIIKAEYASVGLFHLADHRE
jgi:hypothetical protein